MPYVEGFGTTLFLPFEGKVGRGDAQLLLNVQIRGKVLFSCHKR